MNHTSNQGSSAQITSLTEAKAFWEQYETMKSALQLSDMQCYSAFGIDPRRELAFERNFWINTYTSKIHAALAVFRQEYND